MNCPIFGQQGGTDGLDHLLSRELGVSCHADRFSRASFTVRIGTSLSEDDIVKVLTTGGLPKAPHTKAFKGANPTNAKQVAAYVKTLK